MIDQQFIILLVVFVGGTLLGGLLVYALLRARIAGQSQMLDAFKALAADTLHQNSETFLQMAEGKLQQQQQSATANLDKKTVAIDAMIKPVQDSLQRMDEQLKALEVKREGAYRELAQMVTTSRQTQDQLRQETSKLLQALRAPSGRGRWGELQLQRILEMTGMSAHAKDFSTQFVVSDKDGTIRPDVIVALPSGHCVIIDSKVPLSAYLDSVQTDDENKRANALRQHARQLKDHIKTLGNKAYWDKIEGTPEFVVLFLPGEHFLSAALDGDDELMEYSASHKVVLATPMTLIALLRTVAYGWRQEAMRENILEMVDIGRKLHDALNVFSGHMENLGSRLGGAVDFYNKMVRSYDRNVLSKARKFTETGMISGEEELVTPNEIERDLRFSVIENKELLKSQEG
ncbi:MAG: DNA recombination protein RmuC [Alphaproteobacteria bacterium]|jgi:DNA recombination protein RmuC|nr:DNA recombination protein RmuC [Alphaproteobacteria bacterium]